MMHLGKFEYIFLNVVDYGRERRLGTRERGELSVQN